MLAGGERLVFLLSEVHPCVWLLGLVEGMLEIKGPVLFLSNVAHNVSFLVR